MASPSPSSSSDPTAVVIDMEADQAPLKPNGKEKDVGSTSNLEDAQLKVLKGKEIQMCSTSKCTEDGDSSNSNGDTQTPASLNTNSSGAPTPNPASNSTVTFKWEVYDENLKKVKHIAMGTNIFYSLNWFLGFCALTWATTVILGGLVTSIRKRDYYSVAILLVLEALRLATYRFFSFYVTRHLIHGSADPTQLVYNDCRELAAKEILRLVGQTLELAVLSVSIVLPSRRLRDVHYHLHDSCAHEDISACNFNGVLASLRIFYIIVLTNALIAAVGVIYSKTIIYAIVDKPTYALRRYYHSMVWNCIVKGLLHSTDLDIVRFAFEIQALEYRNNKRAPDVMKMYSDLMMYMYEHPHHKGFEAAKVELDSNDTFMREAAANIVGCWISLGIGGGKTLLLQGTLLSKLADAVDHEETGRAATSSFEQMATKFPKETAEVRNSRGQKLVDILIEKIHQVVLQEKPDKAIVFLKVLVKLIDSKEVGYNVIHDSESGSSTLGMLREDLRSIVNSCKFMRTRGVASYALFRLLPRERAVETITACLQRPPKPAQNSEGQNNDQNQVVEEGSGCHYYCNGMLKRAVKTIKARLRRPAGRVENNETHGETMTTSTLDQHANHDVRDNNHVMEGVRRSQNDEACKHAVWAVIKRIPHVVLAVICLAWKYFIMMPVEFLCSFLFIKLSNLLIYAFISFIWKPILDFSVGGLDPTPKSNEKEHILKIEDDYMKKVKKLINYEVHEQLKGVQVRDIGKENSTFVELPKWLKDPKTTNYNVAVIMVFLTVGLCSIFIFHPTFHF